MSDEDNINEQRIYEDDAQTKPIGFVWQVNVILPSGAKEKHYAWSSVQGYKSPFFCTTRTAAIAALREHSKLPVKKTRPSMDQTLMQMAKLMADRATCSRAQVGAVIVIETRPVSSGYNGTATGLPHCNHACDCTKLPTNPDPKHHWADCNSRQPCRFSVHAEANAIAFAAKNGVSTDGATLYTTMAPCLDCAKLIVNAGITRVVAAAQYRDDSGTRLLHQLGVQVHAELL